MFIQIFLQYDNESPVPTEIALFTIEGTPKAEGKPFGFSGKAMVVYVRYKSSPSGWASIRKLFSRLLVKKLDLI